MLHYAGAGVSVATAATADNAISGIWNPSTTKSIFVKEFHIFKTTAGAADIPKVRRTSARGTSASSFTPGIGCNLDHALAPESGLIIDLDWSAEPTLVTGELYGAVVPASIGSGLMWVFGGEGIQVKAGAGLVLVTGSALAFPVSRFAAVWDE